YVPDVTPVAGFVKNYIELVMDTAVDLMNQVTEAIESTVAQADAAYYSSGLYDQPQPSYESQAFIPPTMNIDNYAAIVAKVERESLVKDLEIWKK
nr:hypothetical protein [Gammaproteobacteria bacterium]